MTKKTLKDLIEIEFDRCSTISEFKSEVFRLIDLFESDNEKLYNPTIPIPHQYKSGDEVLCNVPDEVPYGEICSCNPKNGGSGICGCIMGNKMVKNPKKYGYGHFSVNAPTTGIKIDNTVTGPFTLRNITTTNTNSKSVFDFNPKENVFSV